MLTDPPRCPGEDGDVRRAKTPAPGPHPPSGDVHRPGVLQAAAGAKGEFTSIIIWAISMTSCFVHRRKASTTSRWSEWSSSRRFRTPSWPGECVNSLPSIPKYTITTQSLTNHPPCVTADGWVDTPTPSWYGARRSPRTWGTGRSYSRGSTPRCVRSSRSVTRILQWTPGITGITGTIP